MCLICCLPRYEPTNEEILARVKSVAVLQQTQAQVWAALVKRCFCISGSNSKLNWFIQGKAATTEPLWSGTWSWCFPCHCSDRHTRPGHPLQIWYSHIWWSPHKTRSQIADILWKKTEADSIIVAMIDLILVGGAQRRKYSHWRDLHEGWQSCRL